MSDRSATEWKLVNECLRINEMVAQAINEDWRDEPEQKELVLERSDVPELVNSILYHIAETENMAESLTKEIAALQERKARFLKRAENMRKTIEFAFLKFDIKKLETPQATASLSKRSKLVVTNEGSLALEHPELFVRGEPKLNKSALKKMIDEGEIVDGAEMQDRTMLVIRK